MSDGKLIFHTKLDTKGFDSGVLKIKSTSAAIGKGVGSIAKTTATAILGIGTATAAAAGYATKLAIDFESAFAGVRKTVNASESEFKKLEQGILDMSTKIPYAAKDIAAVAESAGQLGIEKDNILQFSEVMLKLGDATNLTAEQAATSFARFANITDMPADKFENLGSTVVALGNNLATTESEITEMSMRLAGTGTQVGLTQAQILGLAGALSSVGINAEAGGSAFSRIMQKMNSEVLGGGKKLQGFAKVSGMSAEQFSTAWKSSPQQAITSFVEGLGKMQQSGGDVAGTLKELGITSIQEIDTLARLSNNTKVLSDALNIANTAWKENTALAKEAEQRYQTTEMKIKLLGTSIQSLAIKVGKEMVESLRGNITQLQDYINQMNDAFEHGGLAELSTKVGEIIGDIAVNIAAQAPKFIEAGTQLITSILDGISSRIDEVSNSAVEIIEALVNGVAEVSNQLIDIGAEIINNLAKGISKNAESIGESASSVINNFINSILEIAPNVLEAGANLVLEIAKGIAQNSDKITSGAIKLVLKLTEIFASNIDTILKIGVDIVKGIAKGIWDSKGEIIKHIPSILATITAAFLTFKAIGIGKHIVGNIALEIAKQKTVMKLSADLIVGMLSMSIKSLGTTALGGAAVSLMTSLGAAISGAGAIIAAAGAKIIAVLVAVLSNPIGLAIAGAGLIFLIAKAILGKKKDVSDATKESVEGGIQEGISGVEPDTQSLVDKITTGLQNGTTSIKEAYSQIINEGFSDSEAREVIYNSGIELGNEFISAIATSKEGVRVAFAELRGDGFSELESVEKLEELGVLNADAFAKGIDDGGQGLIEKYKELREQGLTEADAVEELYRIQGENIQGMVQATDENLPLIAEKFNTYKETLGSSLEALELFREKGLLNTEAFGTGAEEGFNKIQELFNRFSEQGLSTLEIFEKFKNIGLLNTGEGGYAGGILEGGMQLESVYKQLTENGLTALEAQEMMKSMGYKNVEAYVAGISEKSGDATTTIEEVLKSPIEKLTGIKETAKTKGSEVGTGFGSGISESRRNVETASQELSTAAKTGIESRSADIKTAGNKAGQQLAIGISEKKSDAQNAGKEISTSAKTGADSEVGKLKDTGTKGGNEFVSGIKSKKSDAQAAGKELINGVKSGIESANSAATSAVKKLVEQCVNDIKSKSSDFRQAGTELIKNLSEGCKSGEGNLKSSITSLLQSAQNVSRNTIPQFQTIGRQISEGMARGIQSGAGTVQNAARQVAQAAVRAAKSNLGIHSPSKVMAEQVGKPISQGIAVGVKRNANTIYDALGKISDELLTSMAKAHEKVSVFSEEKEKERLEKIKQLNITQVDSAYQEYITLHKDKLNELENQLLLIEDEKSKLKSGKKTEARKKELDADKQLIEDKKKLLEEYSKAFTDNYEKMVNDYSKAMDEIEAKSEKLADKLKNYGDVLETVRDAEGKVVKDEYGNDLLQLADIKDQIAKVTEYGGILSELQARGADTDAMAHMLNMDVDKAVVYGSLLLKKSTAEFEEYMNLMKIKRETAQNIAKRFYQEEKDELNKNFVEGSIKELEKLTGKTSDIGKKSAENLTKGFKSKENEFINVIKEITNKIDQALTQGTSKAIQNANSQLSVALANMQQIINNQFTISTNNSSYSVSGNYGKEQIFQDNFVREMRGRGVKW